MDLITETIQDSEVVRPKAHKKPEPLFLSNDESSIRLFKSDKLEMLTKVHPVTPLVIYVPVIGILMYQAFALRPSLTKINIVSLFASGLLFWTFFEYILHRFAFHLEPIGPITKRIHFLFHGIHHDYPRDAMRLVMPPVVSIGLATGIFFLMKWSLPAFWVNPFFSGFMLGYLFYDMNHYAFHHLNFKWAAWQTLKKNHIKHHYMSPDRGFGVSSPLWDIIFRTRF